MRSKTPDVSLSTSQNAPVARWRWLLFFLFVFGIWFPAEAQLILSESFNYSEGTDLNGVNWSKWGSTSGSVFVSEDAYLADLFGGSHKDYVGKGTAAFRRAKLDYNNTQDLVRNFPALYNPTNAGTVYVSFLVGALDDETSAGSSGVYLLSSSAYTIGVQYRVSSDDHYILSINGRSAGSFTTTGDFQIVITELLVVLKYEFVDGANNDKVSLYLLAGEIPLSEPSTPTLKSESGLDLTNIDRIGLFENGSATGTIDGIRVAKSWSELFQWPLPSNQPTNLQFSNITESSVRLTWTAATSSPFGYLVLRKTGSAMAASTVPDADTYYNVGDVIGDAEVVGTGKGTGYTNHFTSLNNSSLASGTTYYYKIYSYNGSGNYARVRTANPLSGSFTTLALEPSSQPTSLNFNPISSTSMNGSFTAASGQPSGYLVLSKASASPTDLPNDGTVYTAGLTLGASKIVYAGSSTSFSNSGLSGGTLYYYDVFSYNGSGSSINYRTGNPLENSQYTRSTDPSAHPVTFAAVSIPGQINLSFSAPSTITNAYGYLILSTKNGAYPAQTGVNDGMAPGSLSLASGTTLVANITSSATTAFSHTNLTAGTEYKYLIIPYNYNGTDAETYNYKTDGTLKTATAVTLFSSLGTITTDVSFTYPVNIPYASYQEAANLTTGNSMEIGKFMIHDGGDAGSDGDNASTTLTAISFSITNPSLIRRVALYDGVNELAEAAPSGGTVAFSGLDIEAPDNSDKIFSVRASFNSIVTDNLQFSLAVSAVTAASSGSGFASANAGGAATSTAGNNNRIEVTGTKIVYATQPPSVIGVNANVSPVPMLEVWDGFNNKDVDYSSGITVSNSTSLSMINVPTAFSSGKLTFPSDFQFTSYGVTTLTVASGGLSSAISGSIVVRSEEPAAQPSALNFSNVQTNSVDVLLTPAATNPTGYLVLRKANSAPTEEPEDGVLYSGTFNTSDVAYHGTNTTFTSTGLEAGTVYHYAVYAYNGSGQSINYRVTEPLTAEKITLPAPPIAQNVSAQTSNYFKATWTVVPSATKYELDVSLSDSFENFLEDYEGKDVGNTLAHDLNGLLPDTQYYFRVRAVNESGMSANSNFVSVRTATGASSEPLSITNPSFANSTTATISVTVTGGSGNKTVKFFFRGIMAEDFTETIIESTTSRYQTTITPSMADALGLEFYFTAQDASVTEPETTQKPGDVNDYIYQPIPANTTVDLPFGGQVSSYRMISVPYGLALNSTPIVFSALGAYDDTKWRLLRWSGSVYDDNPGSITLGQAYWFNAREKSTISLGEGMVARNNQSAPFSLSLQQGWNMIATPYPFTVDWDDIIGYNGDPEVGDYYIFTGSGYETSNHLEPWKGGFVFADQDTNLLIPVTLKNQAGGRKSAGNPFDGSPDEGNWLVPLTVKQGDLENSLNAFGMHKDAADGKDQFDAIALPRFIEYTELATLHSEYFSPRFMRDVVPLQQSYVWSFTLDASGGGPVEVHWDNQALANSKAQLMLYDAEAGQLTDMRVTGMYSPPSAKGRILEFIFSTDELLPGSNKRPLGSAYPNPFSEEVNLPAFLNTSDGSASVWVSIRNVTGTEVFSRLITTNSKGLLQAAWSGEDSTGNPVAPGLYFYSVVFSDHQRTITNHGKLIKR